MDNFQGSYQNGAGSGDVGQMTTDFNRLSQTIGSNVQKILQNVSSMQRMIANIGTPQDNQQLQTQLHQIQHYTRQLAQDTSKHIKQLNDYADPANISTSVPASDLRQWKLQRERLTNDFTKALNNFQAAQRSAAQKEKDIVKKAKHSGHGGLQAPSRAGNPLIDMEEANQNTTETVMRQQVGPYILYHLYAMVTKLKCEGPESFIISTLQPLSFYSSKFKKKITILNNLKKEKRLYVNLNLI